MDLQTEIWTVFLSFLPGAEPRKTLLTEVLHVQDVGAAVELKVAPFTRPKAHPGPFLCDLGQVCECLLHHGLLEHIAGV